MAAGGRRLAAGRAETQPGMTRCEALRAHG